MSLTRALVALLAVVVAHPAHAKDDRFLIHVGSGVRNVRLKQTTVDQLLQSYPNGDVSKHDDGRVYEVRYTKLPIFKIESDGTVGGILIQEGPWHTPAGVCVGSPARDAKREFPKGQLNHFQQSEVWEVPEYGIELWLDAGKVSMISVEPGKTPPPTSFRAQPGHCTPYPSSVASASPNVTDRFEAVKSALASEANSCGSIRGPRFPLSNAEIAATCSRLGQQFDVELYARPHEVGVTKARTRYRVNVGCQARCYCRDGKNACYLGRPVYMGTVGEKLTREITPSTVRADVDLVLYNDESKGIYAPAARQCFLRRPSDDALSRALADPAAKRDAKNRVVIDAGNFSLIGETSGALIPIHCELACDEARDCRVNVRPAGFDTVDYSDVATALKAASPEQLSAARAAQRNLSTMYLAPAAEPHPAKGTGSPPPSGGSRCEYPFAFQHFYALSGDLALSQRNVEDERENPAAVGNWSSSIGAEIQRHLGFPSFEMFGEIERDVHAFFAWYDKLPADVLALCQKPDRSWPTLRASCGTGGNIEGCIAQLIAAQPILDGIERSAESCHQVCVDHSVPVLRGTELPPSSSSSSGGSAGAKTSSGESGGGAGASSSGFECTVGGNGCTCFPLNGRARRPGTLESCPSYPCCELDIRNAGTPCNCWNSACGGTESEVNVPACPDPRYWEKVKCADRSSPDNFCAAQSAGPCDVAADHCTHP